MNFLLRVTCVALVTHVAFAATPNLKLSWQPVTTMSDGTALPYGSTITYNVYGGHSLTGPFTLATNVSTTHTIRYNVDIGMDCYKVTALLNTVESDPTPVICVNVTKPVSTVPAAPSSLVVTQIE